MSPHGPSGVPPGLVEAVLQVLRSHPGPVRRRAILSELERSGHRVSLAGLNRALDHCARSGLARDTEEGVQLLAPSRAGETAPRGD